MCRRISRARAERSSRGPRRRRRPRHSRPRSRRCRHIPARRSNRSRFRTCVPDVRPDRRKIRRPQPIRLCRPRFLRDRSRSRRPRRPLRRSRLHPRRLRRQRGAGAPVSRIRPVGERSRIPRVAERSQAGNEYALGQSPGGNSGTFARTCDRTRALVLAIATLPCAVFAQGNVAIARTRREDDAARYGGTRRILAFTIVHLSHRGPTE
jgi:hypothetical protein